MHDDWMEYELIFNIPWDVRDSGDNDEQVQEGRRSKSVSKKGHSRGERIMRFPRQPVAVSEGNYTALTASYQNTFSSSGLKTGAEMNKLMDTSPHVAPSMPLNIQRLAPRTSDESLE